MTLKAAIIYVQGSGGNLLARTLTLGEDTIPYVPEHLCTEQPTLELPHSQRLCIYDNWNSENWAESEKLALWYRFGKNDFVNYENSPLHMVAQFHCHEFETEQQKGVLWSSIDQWQHIIFIDFDQPSLSTIAELAKRKRPDLSHHGQIWSKELDSLARLRKTVPFSIHIKWELMLDVDRYLDMVDHVAKLMDIKPIPAQSIRQLHHSWSESTNRILDISRFQHDL